MINSQAEHLLMAKVFLDIWSIDIPKTCEQETGNLRGTARIANLRHASK